MSGDQILYLLRLLVLVLLLQLHKLQLVLKLLLFKSLLLLLLLLKLLQVVTFHFLNVLFQNMRVRHDEYDESTSCVWSITTENRS